MDALTLDQFVVFAAIVDQDGFSGAARKLGRAPSAVTYAVQRLEDQIGSPLFDRTAHRPILNETGRSLLARVRRILRDVEAFKAHAESLAQGYEPQVRLVIDALSPVSLLAPALHDFQATFPGVALRISVESVTAAPRAIEAGEADLGVIVDFGERAGDLERDRIMEVALAAVAAPAHPLAAYAAHTAPIEPDVLRDHVQLVLAEATQDAGPDRGVLAVNTWRITGLAAKHALLLAGLGWGSMPLPMVQDDLDRGRLVRLHPLLWDGARGMPRIPFAVARRRAHKAGPVGAWLFERLCGLGAPPPARPAGEG